MAPTSNNHARNDIVTSEIVSITKQIQGGAR